MFRWAIYENGQLFGQRYSFPAIGDGIGMHTHVEAERHNVVALKGSVEVYGPDRAWSFTLKPGDILDLGPEHHPHEICALEADSEILGLFVNGKPPGLELDEMSGEIHSKPVTLPC